MTRKKLCTYKHHDLYLLGKSGTKLNLEFVDVEGGMTFPFSIDLKPTKLDMVEDYIFATRRYKKMLPADLPSEWYDTVLYILMDYATCYASGNMVVNTFALSDEPRNASRRSFTYVDDGRHIIKFKYPSIRRILRSADILDDSIKYVRELKKATDFIDYVAKNKTISLATIYEGLLFYYENGKLIFTEKNASPESR